MAIGVGARALGMGKAYVAVAENSDTIFNNPAGLGEIDAFEFTSMSGSLLEEVQYTVLGGVYPLGERSAIGIGYAAAAVTAIDIRDTAGTLLQRSNFGNSVLLASYGRKLSEKVSLGINLKFFSQDGNELNDAYGSGMNIDVGFLQKGLGWLSFGLVGQNLLSSGKIHYRSGQEEDLPLSIKIGTRMFLMGEEFESAILSPLELTAVADADLSLQSAKPTTTHLGLEFSPNHFLTLRGGMDQDPQPNGIQNNFTFGVSLNFAGIGFHYAYHPYGNFANNATSYFSLSLDERGWPLDGFPETFFSRKQPPILQI
ncbi:MAG: PorV/PorQ family protein [Candidatus Margulisbacteria bacterium]|nr:PorV/PorQ family protein [Candidatus Margulisiibacteriota bacterium]